MSNNQLEKKINETMNTLLNRRSIRKYKGDTVSKDLIDQIIQAGLYAPSGHGEQSSAVIAVTNKTLRNQIAEENRKIMGVRDGVDPFYGAPVILIVIAKKSSPTAICDGAATITNMLVAAHSLGLGACWINRAKQEFETEFGQNILKQLGITEEYIGIGHIALGYIEGEQPIAIKRKDGRIYYID